MTLKRLAVTMAALAAVAFLPAPVAQGAEEQCTDTPVQVCVIQGNVQLYLLFGAAPGANGDLTIDESGAAVVTIRSQVPAGTATGVAAKGTLEVTTGWGADHAADPEATFVTVSGTIPVEGDLGLESVDVDLVVVGVPGDSGHRGTNCSIGETGSFGSGRSRLADVTGSVGDSALENGVAHIRRYDVCLALRA